ncbi:MAG: hypothetical protein COA57_01610 [Flavobacteriales bacterium]|nr:MAG: hypothetical protein COA57_01610 [Flavobacteriales bacterium]
MKVLIIEDLHPFLKEELEKTDWQCNVQVGISKEKLKEIISTYDGIALRSFKLSKEILEKAKKLKFIARAGSGMENIDVEYAESRGIKCINSPEGNRDAVAEHALGMLLSLFNNLNNADKEVRSGIWDRKGNWGVALQGKTVGIIGFGNTGNAFAKRLQGLDVKIIACDKYKTGFETDLVQEVDLKTLFKETDVLSLHIPLNDETKFMVNNDFIQQFNKSFYLINTSRGKVVKTDDLVEHLKSGKITGACLDVLEYEGELFEEIRNQKPEIRNSSFDYLLKSEKVILSPHVAGWTNEAYLKHSQVLAEKIKTLNSEL